MKEEAQEQLHSPNYYHYRLNNDEILGLSIKEQTEKISYFIRKECNSENLNFFLGSGCSLPAVPLMATTFEKVKKELTNEVLGDFKGENNDIEGYLNWLKNAITFTGEGTAESKKFQDAFDKTKNALIASMPMDYITDTEEYTLMALKNYQNFYNTIFLQREFKKLNPINIFTTNYDLFNEVSMENIGIQYTNGFRGNVNRVFDPAVYHLRLVDTENRYKDRWNAIRRYVKLYKIHGSIDWKYHTILDSIVQSNENSHNDIMIYPTVNKHLESQQSPYSELFREFTINLQKKNSTLIVVGYGFPDDHINQLISQALYNEDFTLIVFGSLDEGNAKHFYRKHSNKKNFHFIGGNISKRGDGHYFDKVIKFLGNGEKYVETE